MSQTVPEKSFENVIASHLWTVRERLRLAVWRMWLTWSMSRKMTSCPSTWTRESPASSPALWAGRPWVMLETESHCPLAQPPVRARPQSWAREVLVRTRVSTTITTLSRITVDCPTSHQQNLYHLPTLRLSLGLCAAAPAFYRLSMLLGIINKTYMEPSQSAATDDGCQTETSLIRPENI